MVFTIICLVGIAFGLYTAVRSAVPALVRHKDPYDGYVDTTPQAKSGTKRNYFFGPGYHQVGAIVQDSYRDQLRQLQKWAAWRESHVEYLNNFRNFFVWVAYIAITLCVAVVGYAALVVVTALYYIVAVLVMCGFFVVFAVLWGVDRLLLLFRSIHSRCPNCKRKSVVPDFVCPECGQVHQKLTPGRYGVFKRRCPCGKLLATMYITGRSAYRAKCPNCGFDLAASDAQQFGIQLIGSVRAGKTAFLAAFWHEYLERVRGVRGLRIQVSPKEAFEDLEQWYHEGSSAATAETNANMYSVIHQFPKTRIQMTIYDVAGEAFESEDNDVQQRQFTYCEGLAFAVDPTADPQEASLAIDNFIKSFQGLKGGRVTKTSDIPVAVMITKADVYKREIGLPKTRTVFNSQPEIWADADGVVTVEAVRNGMCHDFLTNHGFGNAVNLVESKFANVQYYAVSAMGHTDEEHGEYQPWGVLEPVGWLMEQQETVLWDVLPAMLESELSGPPALQPSKKLLVRL